MKELNKHFTVYIYIFALATYAIILFQAVNENLLPIPTEGTDQLTMLKTAVGIYKGKLPEEPYIFSSAYTVFLTFLVFLTKGNLIAIRFLQAALCALIPVMIYKTGRKIGFSREISQLSSLIYCFYGASALISLDFLREAPLALCFIMLAYCLISAVISKKMFFFISAGIFAGLTVLGRENFIPIVIIGPLAILIFKNIRRRVNIYNAISYFTVFILVLLPLLLYNVYRFESFSLVPGHVKNVLGAYHGNTAANNITAAVVSILKNIPSQIYKFSSSYEIPNSLSFYAHREMIPILWVLFIPFNLLLGSALIGAFCSRKNIGVVFISLLALLYMISMIFFEMFYRFRISVIPLLSILAGAGLYAIIRNGNKRQKWILISFLACFFLLTYTSPNKLRTHQERISVAEVMIYNGNYNKAVDYLENMEKDSIKCDFLWVNLISELEKNNDLGRAEDVKRIYIELKNFRKPADNL